MEDKFLKDVNGKYILANVVEARKEQWSTRLTEPTSTDGMCVGFCSEPKVKRTPKETKEGQ